MLVSNMAIYVSMSIHTNFFLLVNVSHVLNLARYRYLFPRTHSSTLALLLLDRSRVIEDASVCKMRYELEIVSTKVKKRVITNESQERNNSKITSNNKTYFTCRKSKQYYSGRFVTMELAMSKLD